MSEVTKFFAIDTETMGIDGRSKILSISVVFFDTTKDGKNLSEIFADGDVFHMNFDIKHQDEYGLVTNPETYNWWKSVITNEQNPEARKRIINEIHNGKKMFSDFVREFDLWLKTKISKTDNYYVFERQLGFDRERFNMLYSLTDGSKPPLNHWRFADTRTWIRKSKLNPIFAQGDKWSDDCVRRLFGDFPYVKHHSVDDALLDGFMIKLMVQTNQTFL